MGEPRSILEAELQRAVGFGDAELAANRAGHITRRQALRLALRDALIWLAFVFIAGLLVMSVGYVLFVPIVVVFGRGVPPDGLVAVLLSALLMVGFAFMFRWGAIYFLDRARRSLDELRAGAVTSREGTMSAVQERVEMERGYSYAHYVVAGDERFSVSFALYRVFEDGEDYRIYYMPDSRVVVAVEALDRYGQSGRLRHHHRWGHLDLQIWWVLLIVVSVGLVVAGLYLGNAPVVLIGIGSFALSAFAAIWFVRGF